LVLPDTETVTHVYDAGGSLLSFAGEKSGTKVSYLNLVHYDKFEQRTRLVLGNGIETKYAYDPASRRLDTLTSAGARAGTFQNLHYGYDNVGNILSLNNQVAVPPPTTFGGPNKQQFGYDDLYRLTEAKGEYKSAPDKVRNYTLALTYDTNHNILAKTQSDVITVAGGSAIPQKGTSYDWQYDYAGSQPHAPTHIGNRSFTYDLNGNQTGWESDVNGTRRHILWDERTASAKSTTTASATATSTTPRESAPSSSPSRARPSTSTSITWCATEASSASTCLQARVASSATWSWVPRPATSSAALRATGTAATRRRRRPRPATATRAT
jgi:YD repeat-containing protein